MPAWLAVIEREPAATIVTVLPETVQTEVVVEAKLTARPEFAVALTVYGETPNVTLLRAPKVMVCAAPLAEELCVTVICWPSTVMCATRAEPVEFAVKEKLTTPFVIVPMVSHLWSLEGAKTPLRGCVEGTTGSNASDPAAEPSVKPLAGPTKLPSTLCASAPKVIVWRVWAWIVKLALTGVAPEKNVLPVCAAGMVQVPAATRVTVVPETVHAEGVVEVKLTVRPEEADALRVNVPLPSVRVGSGPNAMAWLNWAGKEISRSW